MELQTRPQQRSDFDRPAFDSGAGRAGRGAWASAALAHGTRLRDYELDEPVAVTACSIVYAGFDHALQRKVAIKEYLPGELASRPAGAVDVDVRGDHNVDAFRAGLRAFVQEARLFAKVDHHSLLKVYRFWEDNGTAYMAMPFHEGPTLRAALAELGYVPVEHELRIWLRPVLDAVATLHDGGIWHENIAPESIVLTQGGPLLLGMAAAERAIAASRRAPAAALSAGFAAIEQYGSVAAATRGPWTDLYALAAVVYAAIAGTDPQPAAERFRDDRLRPLALLAAGLYSHEFLTAIDAAMAIQPQRRPADHLAFRALMGDLDAPARLQLTPPRDLMQEPFIGTIGRTANDDEITVPDRPLPAATATVAAAAVAGTSIPRGAAVAPVAALHPPPVARGVAEGDHAAPRSRPSQPSPLGVEPRADASRGSVRSGARIGIVAASLAALGLVALGWQFLPRAAAPAAMLPAAAVPAAVMPAAVLPAVAPPEASPTFPPSAPSPAAATTTPPVVATPSAAPPQAAAMTPSPATSTAAPAATTAAAPPSPPDLRTRCLEILQKASLEPITAAETAFFKKECR